MIIIYYSSSPDKKSARVSTLKVSIVLILGASQESVVFVCSRGSAMAGVRGIMSSMNL